MASLVTAKSEPISVEEQKKARLDEKLRRELGYMVLTALSNDRTEDICLNPDGKLWINELGVGWKVVGRMDSSFALSAMGTIATIKETAITPERRAIAARSESVSSATTTGESLACEAPRAVPRTASAWVVELKVTR